MCLLDCLNLKYELNMVGIIIFTKLLEESITFGISFDSIDASYS